MRRKETNQLTFDFIPDIDRELAEKREREREELARRCQDSWLHSAVEDLPPAAEEWDVILMGIRLCRHVHDSECQRCKLGHYNHCPDALGTYYDETYQWSNPIKVCLKDYFRWCAQHGLKSWVKKALNK
jgi:hypothetical protein